VSIRLSKLGGTDFIEEGLKPTIDLVPTFEAVLSAGAIGHAENSYKILQVADVFTNGPNTAADEFTDATGTKNTVNTGTSTAIFKTNKYEIVGQTSSYTTSSGSTHNVAIAGEGATFTNPSNAFDGNAGTAANGILENGGTTGTHTNALGKTFSNNVIGQIDYNFTYNTAALHAETITVKLQGYNGSSWTDISTLYTQSWGSGVARNATYNTTGSYTTDITYQGLRLYCDLNRTIQNGTGIASVDIYEFQYYTGYSSSSTVICDSNTITLDGTEKALIISTPDSIWNTGSSMTVTASDGTTSTSAQTINSTSKNTGVFSISSLSSGTLKLTFTLATSDTTLSPEFKGYGVYVIR